MANALEGRLDKYVATDAIDRLARIIEAEQQRERVIIDRRRVSRVPGAVVQFIPADWVERGGVAESYSTQLLPPKQLRENS